MAEWLWHWISGQEAGSNPQDDFFFQQHPTVLDIGFISTFSQLYFEVWIIVVVNITITWSSWPWEGLVSTIFLWVYDTTHWIDTTAETREKIKFGNYRIWGKIKKWDSKGKGRKMRDFFQLRTVDLRRHRGQYFHIGGSTEQCVLSPVNFPPNRASSDLS